MMEPGVVSFGIRKCESSGFLISIQDVLAIWIPLKLHMNFRIIFSISEQNVFGKDCTESVSFFG